MRQTRPRPRFVCAFMLVPFLLWLPACNDSSTGNQGDGGPEDGVDGWLPGEWGDLGGIDGGGHKGCTGPEQCDPGQKCHQGFCVEVIEDPDCQVGDEDSCENDTYCEPTLGGCVPWDAPPLNDPGCEYIPPIEQFTPKEEWIWESPAEKPEWNEVIMTPVVVDLTGKAGQQEGFVVPEVIFNSFRKDLGYTQDGVLRAVWGNNGAPIFSVTDPLYATHPVSSIAAGDIDADGLPEIVTGKTGGRDLICFESDGKFKWATSTDSLVVGWGGPAIANVDGVGLPEIVMGAAVVNADGTVRWKKEGSRGDNYADKAGAPFSIPLDVLDNPDDPADDGKMEIVTGEALYDADGNEIWNNGLGDGFVAVAEFTGDERPEVVVVSRGTVRLQRADNGNVIWLKTAEELNALPECKPNCGYLGPPTVADFDKDNSPEIGIAGSDVYLVLDTWGKVNWHTLTRDASSNITGSAVFDFEGDRQAEVVYADEEHLRVYRGTDGKVLYEQDHSSITACEYPVVADVDGDHNAEIVIAQNTLIEGVAKKFHGIRVFGDAKDNWVNTRRIWNQHAYNVTNVEENGAIPVSPRKNWQTQWKDAGLNNFRQNVQGEGLFDAPDLTAEGLGYLTAFCVSRGIALYAQITNRGDQELPPGVPVSFYLGDPRQGGTLLGTLQTTRALAPGEGEQIAFVWEDPPLRQPRDIYVVADDAGWDKANNRPAGQHNECRELNNIGLFKDVVCKPDV